ncbi:hypothetical protein THAOC_13101 [Thalassiosira oceanica]|uniref:Uncharacterized protein n=1 Tax=Thalassiosira oceanica TaxID=159749 RepID=K0SID6_THAOC|nr:hypothetical protein THAOC_13101 [Thalassiosira oceanica]|eukprot:EJK65993.1 hypothetical protein THAOC_13101 [Thalassiosira oceanica]
MSTANAPADSGGEGATPRGHTNRPGSYNSRRNNNRAEAAQRYRESQEFDNPDNTMQKLYLGNGGGNAANQIREFTKALQQLYEHIQTNPTDFPEHAGEIADGFIKGEMPKCTPPTKPTMPTKTDAQ